MDLVCVYMSQVVAGPMDRFAFYSGQFGSCSPLFVYNSRLNWGGYYHVPGHTGKGVTDDDKAICEALIDAVSPTSAYVFHPGDYQSPDEKRDIQTLAGLSTTDADDLVGLLAKVSAARATRLDIRKTGQAMRGMLAYVRDGGLFFTKDVNQAGPYGKVYCSKRGPRPPGCGVKNWNVDTSVFFRLAEEAKIGR